MLSGFCIAMGYESQFDVSVNAKNYFSFVKKRWYRLWPLYAFTMFIAAVAQIIKSGGIHLIWETITQFLKAATMLQTLSLSDWGILNSAGWYCSCIFILYLITPFIIAIINKCRRKELIILLMIFLIFPLLEKRAYLHLKQIEVISEAEFGQLLYTFPIHRIPMYIEGIILFKFKKSLRSCHLLCNKLCNSILEMVIILGNILFMLGIFDNITFISKYSILIQSVLIGSWIYVFSFEEGAVSMKLAKLKIPDLSYEIYLIHYVLIINCGFREIMPIWLGTSISAYFIEVIIVFVLTVVLALLWKRFIAIRK